MWSLEFEKCIECGTTVRKHIARGLCKICYDRATENRHKIGNRERGIAAGKLTKEYLIKEYIENKNSLSEIAIECSCSRQYVYKRIKYFNVPLRQKKQSRDLALKREKLIFERIDEDGEIEKIVLQKTRVNEEFFAHWTKEMAWVLGLIYTDGNLDPGRILDPKRKTTLAIPRFSLFQKEKKILEKVAILMNSNTRIIYRKERVYKGIKAGALYLFHVNNEKVYNDLLKLGLMPDKSRIIRFPDMPEEYVRHFIRGCWDGDGSVYLQNAGKSNENIIAHFVSGSYEFVHELEKKLQEFGLKKRDIKSTKSENPSYYIKYFGMKQCGKIFNIFYSGVGKDNYMERKYEVFYEFLKKKKTKKISKQRD